MWVWSGKIHVFDPVHNIPLSDFKIRKAKQKDKPYRTSDGLGLFLLVSTSGTKSWQFRYQFIGKDPRIGQYPIVTLAEARQKRDDAKRLLTEGKDPSIEKKLGQIDAAVKARMTFKEIADEYYDTLVDRGLADAKLRRSDGTSMI